MNSYILSRQWFSFAYENPKVKPVHTALYFWIVERANVSGWKKIIDIQTEKSMECLGITDWRTYKNALQVLADSGFVIWVERSKNQYTCNRISLVENAAELSEAFKNSNPDNQKAAAQNAEAIAEAIAEAYAEADVKAIAKALQSYINLQTTKPTKLKNPKTDQGEGLELIFEVEDSEQTEEASHTGPPPEFEAARKLWPDVKRGPMVEFENFKKKHSDWQTEMPKLLPAVEAFIEWREAKLKIEGKKPFAPHFATWINQKRWTEELPIPYDPQNQLGKSQVQKRAEQSQAAWQILDATREEAA